MGMFGFGWMGANLVRRLMRHCHEFVVCDPNPDSDTASSADGAAGVRSVHKLVSQATALDATRGQL